MSAFNTINATVLAKNSIVAFICNPCGGYGQTLPIPCGDNALPGTEYWAVPVKDAYFQGFRLVAYVTGSTPPTFDAIRCFKVTNLLNSDYYIVAGSVAGYVGACAACCGTSPAPSLLTTLADIAVCQDTCTSDGTNYDAFFAVESIADVPGGRYVARVSVNNSFVYQQTFGFGNVNIAGLIVSLNIAAGSVGVWSNLPGTNTIRLRTTTAKNVCFIACIKTS